jgi:hypothetical protein
VPFTGAERAIIELIIYRHRLAVTAHEVKLAEVLFISSI